MSLPPCSLVPRRSFVAALVTMLAVACTVSTTPGASAGSGGAGAGDGGVAAGDGASTPVSAESACAAWASAVCERMETCAPRFVDQLYGDAQACVARYVLACARHVAVGIAPSAVAACASAFADVTCEAYYETPAACAFRGPAADGAGCADGSECASGRCSIVPRGCGVCLPSGGEGEACGTALACGQNLICLGGKCRPYATRGEACGTASYCTFGLACVDGRCGDPLAEGAPCEGNEGACLDGTCTAEKRCRAYPIVGAGEACGGQAPALCGASGICRDGRCLAAAADGEACDPAGTGPLCRWPARCEAEAGSVCVVPAADACR